MENKLKIKAILFDLDDTLLNSKKAEYNAICEFKNLHSEFNEVKDINFGEVWSKITLELYEKYHKGEISFEELRIERMKELFSKYSINISDDDAKEAFKDYKNIYEKNWILFDDTKEVLEKLKNRYKLVIVSNGDGIWQRKKIKETGLNKYFSNIVISSEVGCSKPEKEIFEIAYKMVNLKPEDCVMIGDKYKVDVEGSLNAGMYGIWVNRKKEQLSYKYQINELNELTKYL